ncbi:MAG: hypothetical protein FWE10_05560 [Rikenellaceae bacterium]|nr:hypothetical protein [Rikenellaceae bacterium]MCL2693340.1 hypothetical protein [Rikenellaceae bacterium]
MKEKEKELLPEAMRKAGGIVSYACAKLGIDRRTYYRWLKDDPELAAEIEDIKDERLDIVEDALFKRIEAGDTAAIIFACKTLGKKRGYTEKQEVEVSGSMTYSVDKLVLTNDFGEELEIDGNEI